jgi:hypothetical protein
VLVLSKRINVHVLNSYLKEVKGESGKITRKKPREEKQDGYCLPLCGKTARGFPLIALSIFGHRKYQFNMPEP